MEVAGYPAPVRHPLLERETFEKLQRNDVVEIRPHILHFGGFQVHKAHSHVVKVVNISPSSLRVSIIGPSSPWFKIDFDKKGLLAPGMSEDITVTFEPHEWRYYYDTIKIFCGDLSENLLVPIHAYPAANDIVLPRLLDFGATAIGTTRSKVIPLSCKIPIKFEFEITILEAHPDISIFPLRGVIPADEGTEIQVTFTPSRHASARAELRFHIEQFNFQPVLVSVVGCCTPEATKMELLQNEVAEQHAIAQQKQQEKFAATADKVKLAKSKGPMQLRLPKFKSEELERTMSGIKVPTTRMDQQATNFVLTQTAGKLPLKDLVTFIREQREVADQRRQRVNATVGSMEEVEDDRQAKELRFELQYREVDKRDKDKELKNTRATGEEPPNEDAIQEVHETRRKRYERLFRSRINQDVSRVESVLSQERIAVPGNFKPIARPAWDECANDTFSVRLQVIERFVRAGSKVLMRVRARQRCQLLIEALKEAGVSDRDSCRAWVEAENKAAASGTLVKADKVKKETVSADDEADGSLPVIHIPEDFVLPLQTPTKTVGFSAEERQPVEMVQLDNFEEFLSVEPNVRLDYKVLDYPLHDVPPASAYMKPSERVRLSGALEEQLIGGERGDVLDGAEMPVAMPESCLLAPAHDALSLLIPDTHCRTYVAFPECVECDPNFRLAQKPELLVPLEPPLLPDAMSLESPWLESWRGQRQLEDPFGRQDGFGLSFVEPQMGFLGSDLGGPRLNFLPCGGLDRDLPSDTDDDEQPDFHIAAPAREAEDKALQALDSAPPSEMWHKEEVAEKRLQELCASNGRAVRDRLSQLNAEMSRKLFLGRQIKEIYCKEQRDFSNSEEWDEYLMLREDIIYKLVNSSKEEVLETWRQVDRYKAQHLAEIRQKQTARPKEVLEKVAAVITAEGDFAGRVNANWAEAKFQHPLQDQYNSLLKELPQSPGHILGTGGDSPMAPQPLLGDGRGGETGDAALRLRSGGGQLDVGLQKARYFFFSDLARLPRT
ncbi:unnamed protein product [Effrenium voratum]|nr:unnamed protein product [Effrenium voratum]